MKSCKECTEWSCGGQGSDRVSMSCNTGVGFAVPNEDEETYILTPGAMLWVTVKDWRLTDEWNQKVYEAAFEDLMNRLVKSGYLMDGGSE